MITNMQNNGAGSMNDSRYIKYIDGLYTFYINDEVTYNLDQDISKCTTTQKTRLSDVVVFDGNVIKNRFHYIHLFIEGLYTLSVVATIYLDEPSDDCN